MNKIIATLSILLFSCMPGLAQKKSFVFATYTYSTNTRLQNLEPLTKYLSEKTGYTITARSYPTVNQLISAIENDSVDFAMINTLGYLLLRHRNQGRALPFQTLHMPYEGNTQYGGCLIALKSANIRSLNDLKRMDSKASLHLVNASSTSGNLVPLLLLNRSGFPDADTSFSISYAGTHKAVVDNVLSGKAMMGGCGCAEVDSARQHRNFNQQALVLDSFNNIPLGPVVHHQDVPGAVVSSISHWLSVVHTENAAAFDAFRSGWTEFRMATQFKKASDEDYDAFRTMFGSNTRLWKLIE